MDRVGDGRSRFLNGFRSALSTFTTVPVRADVLDRDAARSTLAWLPVVGFWLGVVAALPLVVAGPGSGPALLGAVLALGLVAWLTGGLHLDGLADTADGLGSRRPAAEALAVMRRSDIGPMGVLALVFVLGLDVAALASLPSALGVATIVVAQITGRVCCVVASRRGVRAARPDGFGVLFADTTAPAAAWGWAGAVIVLGLVGGWLADGRLGSALALGAGVLIALAVSIGFMRRIAARLGGVTGDVYGALIEIGVCGCLVGTALLA